MPHMHESFSYEEFLENMYAIARLRDSFLGLGFRTYEQAAEFAYQVFIRDNGTRMAICISLTPKRYFEYVDQFLDELEELDRVRRARNADYN